MNVGSEAIVGIVPVGHAPQLDEDFLHGVFGVGRVADKRRTIDHTNPP